MVRILAGTFTMGGGAGDPADSYEDDQVTLTHDVWEWTQDWYDDYPSGSVPDPVGASSGSYRVNRGGDWDDDAGGASVSYRGGGGPGGSNVSLGFRLSRSIAP